MSASESFKGLTVMVIDDSNTIRRSAEIFLGKTGAKVVLAEDGFDALAKIADHQPDLIFCDVLMPRLDGYQTCALIKKSPKFKTTPVVMLSSKDGLFDKAKGKMVGSDHYLTKPFTKDSLLQAVGEFARRSPSAAALPPSTVAGSPVVAVPVLAVPVVAGSVVTSIEAASPAASNSFPALPVLSVPVPVSSPVAAPVSVPDDKAQAQAQAQPQPQPQPQSFTPPNEFAVSFSLDLNEDMSPPAMDLSTDLAGVSPASDQSDAGEPPQEKFTLSLV